MRKSTRNDSSWLLSLFLTTIASKSWCRYAVWRWAACSWPVSSFVMIACQTQSTLWTSSRRTSTFNNIRWLSKRQVRRRKLHLKSSLCNHVCSFQCRYGRASSSPPPTPTLSRPPSSGDDTWGRRKFSIAIAKDVEIRPSCPLMGAPWCANDAAAESALWTRWTKHRRGCATSANHDRAMR